MVHDIGHDMQNKCHVEIQWLKKIWTQQDLHDMSKECSGVLVEERKMMHAMTVLLNIWNG